MKSGTLGAGGVLFPDDPSKLGGSMCAATFKPVMPQNSASKLVALNSDCAAESNNSVPRFPGNSRNADSVEISKRKHKYQI
jgi:hypothetical protein